MGPYSKVSAKVPHSTFCCPLSPITESKTKTYVDFVQLPPAVSGADLSTCYQMPSHQTCCWNAEDLKVKTFSSRASKIKAKEGEWSTTRKDLTKKENNTIFPRTLAGLWSWDLQLHHTVTWRHSYSSGQHSACSCSHCRERRAGWKHVVHQLINRLTTVWYTYTTE